MKKVFFFALASLALASCSQDDELFAPEKSKGSNRTNSNVLSFSTYTAGGTRATDVFSAQVVASGFQVAAWYDGSLYFQDSARFEAGLAIDNDSIVTGAFDTKGDTYYWPAVTADNTIGFRAFNNLKKAAEWADADCKTIKFTVQDSASTQEDLVIAYAEAGKKPLERDGALADGVQALNFTHALSKVNFTFVGEDAAHTYTINKIEMIAGGEDDAVMTFYETTELGANGTTDGDQPNTNNQAKKAVWDFTQIDGNEKLVDAGAPAQGKLYTYSVDTIKADGTKLNNSFMVLPQADSIAIRVYYKVNDKNGKMIGNCGFYKTDSKGHHEYADTLDADDKLVPNVKFVEDENTIYGCKTVIVSLGELFTNGFEAGKAYRFTMTLPTDNFIGDRDADKTADGLGEGDVDLDGDNDKSASEFDQLTPIRFSVTVSDWDNKNGDEYTSDITVK